MTRLVLLDRVDRADPRMIERGRGARLSLEALERRLVVRQVIRQNFNATLRPSFVSSAS